MAPFGHAAKDIMGWANEAFQGIDLGDQRRNRRAIQLVEWLAERLTESLPGACRG